MCQIVLPANVEAQALLVFLLELNNDFLPPLSSKVNIAEYIEKLKRNALFCIAYNKTNSQIIGMIAFYCNDPDKKNAYISILGVSAIERGHGIGRKLLCEVLAYVEKERFKSISLQTWEGNRVQSLYESQGFSVFEKVSDRPNGLCSIKMIKHFNEMM